MSLNYKYYNANGEQVTEEGGEESFVAKLEVFVRECVQISVGNPIMGNGPD